MPPLTAAQLTELQRIIEDHHLALAVEFAGVGAAGFGPEDIQRLVASGILDEAAARALAVDIMGDAVGLSMLTVHLSQAIDPKPGDDPTSWSYKKLRKRLQANPLPMSDDQRGALDAARRSAGAYCRGLGNRISDDFERIAVNADVELQRQLTTTIREETARAVVENRSAAKLRSDLGNATGDWSRNWDRIARTELQRAANDGAAGEIAERFGPDARVARRPNPNACDACNELFLQADGRPIIWKLSDLVANGSNVGRKQAEWKATLDPVHPHCHCEVVYVPTGASFDKDHRLVWPE